MLGALRDPWLWALFALNLAFKAPLLGLNEAEYTDGLILLRLFDNRCPFYMPLYPLLVKVGIAAGADPTAAGRLVSLLAHVLTLLPLALVAQRLTGNRAVVLWTLAVYSLSPLPNRWALHVMTDSLFTFLWWSTIAAWMGSALPSPAPRGESSHPSPGLFPREGGSGSQGKSNAQRATGNWSAATLALGALAALTRQTGWLLLPLGLIALFALIRQRGRPPLGQVLALALWALPLAWMLWVGGFAGHGGQIAQRLTWRAALDTVEAYAVDWPLFAGWPLAILALWGLFRPLGSGPAWRSFLALMIWATAGVLGLQVLIQSYLARYLLPLVGFLSLLAGGALARLGAERPRWVMPVAAVALGWLALSTISTLWLQRTAWGDFRRGAERMGEVAGPETPCFTNETYPTWPPVGTAKAEFWSGRRVQPIISDTGRLVDFPPGSLVLLSSAYGGPRVYGQLLETIRQRQPAETIGQWESRLVPLLPDIMDGRVQMLIDGEVTVGLHQNPLAVRLRRSPQVFQTTLLRILGEAGPR